MTHTVPRRHLQIAQTAPIAPSSAPTPDLREPAALERAWLAASFGRTGVAPFVANPDAEVISLLDGLGCAGYVPVRRWAVTAGDVIAPPGYGEWAVTEYLGSLRQRRLRPAFVAVADPEPFAQLGFDVTELADEAVLELASFSLAGSARANLRHSVTSARRAGLTIAAYEPRFAEQIAQLSQQWLRTKRGGELGFTLSRHEDVAAQLNCGATDAWVLLDAAGTVQAWCTWRHYLGGRARVIDVMRRRLEAPNPSMDLLLAGTIEHYRDQGVQFASLASVPREHGDAAERIYPTRSLRAYKQKFNPTWEPRYLAVPRKWRRPFALAAIGTAYCPGGMRRALRRNG